MKATKVALLLGSDSDLPKVQGALDVFAKFEIQCDVRILSAHRTPEAVKEFVTSARESGYSILLAGAGGAAHLAGTVAAHSRLPVLGLPFDNPPLGGLDALLSTVQMPGGIPVATFGVGSGGPTNAALFAVRILALQDEKLRQALEKYQDEMKNKVLQKDREVSQSKSVPGKKA